MKSPGMGKVKGMSEPVRDGSGYIYTFTLEGLQEFLQNYYEIYGEYPEAFLKALKENGD